MIPSEWQEVARAIHASGHHLVIAVTGGGTGALSTLLQTPGASRSVLEAIVPYSLASLTDWIGGQPDQACSEATARAMAMAAFMRARELAPDADAEKLVGVGCTASLATVRPKRGPRRIHAAVQRADRTDVYSLSLVDSTPTRARDENVATGFMLWVVAAACGAEASSLEASLPLGPHGELRRCVFEPAPAERTELLLGARELVVLKPNSAWEHFGRTESPPLPVVFPGAFNPPHAGHLQMAAIAEGRLMRTVAWELSITNVDKPPLDFIAIRQRVQRLRVEDAHRPIALTRTPTFREKAELFPGATFVVGADTMMRIAEPRYYGSDDARREAAIAEIGRRGCRFLVFGRVVDGRFMTLSDLNLPSELRSLCDEVPANEYREDVSSTGLRTVR